MSRSSGRRTALQARPGAGRGGGAGGLLPDRYGPISHPEESYSLLAEAVAAVAAVAALALLALHGVRGRGRA